jgi:hypothetical protein
VQAPMSEFSRDRGISRFPCGANLLIRVVGVAGCTRPQILLNAGNRRAGLAPPALGVGVDDRGSRSAVRQVLRAGVRVCGVEGRAARHRARTHQRVLVGRYGDERRGRLADCTGNVSLR